MSWLTRDRGACAALLTIVMLVPYLPLGWEALGGGASGFPAWDAKAQSTFLSSLLLCALVCLLAFALAVATLLLLWLAKPGGLRLALHGCLLVLFALSPVIQLAGWRGLLFLPSLHPLAATTLVLAWKYFPLMVWLALASLQTEDAAAIEAIRGVSDSGQALAQLLVPALAPALLAGAAAVAALVLLEGEVPPLLGLDVYASDYMGRLALDSSAAGALHAAWPFLVAGLTLVGLVATWIRTAARPGQGGGALPALDACRPGGPGARVLAALAALVFLSPLLALVPIALTEGLARAGGADLRALGTSCLLGVACAGVASILSYLLASCLIATSEALRLLLLAMLGVGLLVPGTLTGVAVAQLAASPALGSLPQGDLPLIVAHTLRLLPTGTLLMFALQWAQPPAVRDELRLTGAPWLAEQRFISLPMHWPGVVAVCGLLFVLALSELSSTVLVVAPGTETVILRLYNLMHYGAAESVALLALAQALLTAGVVSGMFVLGRSSWHVAYRAG